MNKEILIRLDARIAKTELKGRYEKYSSIDHTGIKFYARELYIFGISLILLESNKYHKNGDFEIGFTYDNITEWNSFENQLNEKMDDIEIGKNNNSRYAVIKESSLHLPFFFIFDKKYSENADFVLTGELSDKGYEFYNRKIIKLIDKKYCGNMKFKRSMDEIARLNEISFPTNIETDEVFNIKIESLDIIVENNIFSLRMN